MDYFTAGIPCFFFLFVFFFWFFFTALLCRPEEILIHRDGVGLSELTAECSLSFGNCLWVSSIYFFHLNVSKVGWMPALPAVGMFGPVCGAPAVRLDDADMHRFASLLDAL